MSEQKGWLKTLAGMLKTIEEFEKPRDRLASLSQIFQARNAVVFSSNNWMYWLGNPVFLDTLTDEQVERIRVFWSDVAAKMIRFDYDITSEVDFIKKDETKRGRIGIEPD